ncbi:hypothetical protein [Spiroplasma endosymbiont of Amphibalanus improvisus]|uniref:hypothetical protein n=1 Tax=Spiroplasma endosymbiont of Amphibalanus improvisus TaxID=3066327 RepID=UPI00313E52C7
MSIFNNAVSSKKYLLFAKNFQEILNIYFSLNKNSAKLITWLNNASNQLFSFELNNAFSLFKIDFPNNEKLKKINFTFNKDFTDFTSDFPKKYETLISTLQSDTSKQKIIDSFFCKNNQVILFFELIYNLINIVIFEHKEDPNFTSYEKTSLICIQKYIRQTTDEFKIGVVSKKLQGYNVSEFKIKDIIEKEKKEYKSDDIIYLNNLLLLFSKSRGLKSKILLLKNFVPYINNLQKDIKHINPDLMEKIKIVIKEIKDNENIKINNKKLEEQIDEVIERLGIVLIKLISDLVKQ